MRKTINAKPAEWSPAITDRWDSFDKPDGKIVTANWYTARPYQDEYSTGSEVEGFCFTVLKGYDHQVYDKHWHVGRPAEAYTEPKSKGET